MVSLSKKMTIPSEKLDFIAQKDALTYEYKLTMSDGKQLPNWLKYDEYSRTLEGTPSEAGKYPLKYSVYDSTGRTASSKFDLIVKEDLAPSFRAASETYLLGRDSEITVALPRATGGNGDILYTLKDQDQLPDGLSYDEERGTITGSASDISDRVVTWVAIDEDEDSAEFNVTLQVEEERNPEVADIANNSVVQANERVEIEVGSISSEGNGDIVFDFRTNNATGLPAGLSFNEDSLSIEGIPEEVGNFSIEMTVSDSDLNEDISDMHVVSFSLEVIGEISVQEDDSIAFFALYVGMLNEHQLAEGQTGALPYTYEVKIDGSSELPAWMSFDNQTLLLSATPTEVDTFQLEYVVTDSQSVEVSTYFLVSVELQTVVFEFEVIRFSS